MELSNSHLIRTGASADRMTGIATLSVLDRTPPVNNSLLLRDQNEGVSDSDSPWLRLSQLSATLLLLLTAVLTTFLEFVYGSLCFLTARRPFYSELSKSRSSFAPMTVGGLATMVLGVSQKSLGWNQTPPGLMLLSHTGTFQLPCLSHKIEHGT